MTKICIIIVNWNTGKLLAQCLYSIASLPASEKALINNVIVIDNDSSDQSIELAKQASGLAVEFIELKKNDGFAKANNRGIKIALKEAGDDQHFFLLNPDTELWAGSLTTLLKTLEADSRIGIVGPKLLNSDGTAQSSVRANPTLGSLAFVFLKLHRVFPNAPIWQRYMKSSFDYNQQSDVDQIMGAAFLIKKETVEDVGLLDERFWIWFEEVDYCRRARSKNWRVVYAPRAQVMHHGGVSFNQLVGYRRSTPFFSSAIKYARKHLGLPSALLLTCLLPLSFVLVLPASAYHVISKARNKARL